MGVKAQLLELGRLDPNRRRKRTHQRKRAKRIKRDSEPADHAARDILANGQIGTPNYPPSLFIDDEEIELCMIYLHHRERPLDAISVVDKIERFARCAGTFAFLHNFPRGNGGNARLERIARYGCAWSRYFRISAVELP
jgi:hypothetical protein